MRKIFHLILLMVLLSSVSLSGQVLTRQAGLRMGYRSGIFYQVSSETGNAETGYNAMISFNRVITATLLLRYPHVNGFEVFPVTCRYNDDISRRLSIMSILSTRYFESNLKS